MRTVLSVCFALSVVGCKKAPPPAPIVLPVVMREGAAAEAPADPEPLPPAGRVFDFSQPAASTLNGALDGPKQADFDAVQADGQRKVQACLDAMAATTVLPNGNATVAVRLTVGNDGKPKDVAVTSEVPADAVACAKGAVEGLVFPSFTGSMVNSSFTITYHRSAPPAAAPK